MRAAPADLDASALLAVATDSWGFAARRAEYAAVGGGSHHWVLTDGAGARRFATVDDLDNKAWLANTRDAAFAGLGRAFETALALAGSGLTFVVAPLPTERGDALLRLSARYTVALFPYLEGRPGVFGRYDPVAREAVGAILAKLHAATPTVASTARTVGVTVPGREHVEAALGHLQVPWRGGPFSEPARAVLAARASEVAELLALADRLSALVLARNRPWVITHGEPHAANVIEAGRQHFLVDWDTVALAPPERDFWLLAGDDLRRDDLDQDALALFRLSWDLNDLASYLNVLRAPHAENEDTRRALTGVTNCAASRDRWRHLL